MELFKYFFAIFRLIKHQFFVAKLQKKEAYDNIEKKLSVETGRGSGKNSEIKEIVINNDNNVKSKKLRFF